MNKSMRVDDLGVAEINMKPAINEQQNPSKYISNLQYEIEKYQKQIELMQLKLDLKDQLIEYKIDENNGFRPRQSKGVPMQVFCGLGP